jgi:hypothetical protein
MLRPCATALLLLVAAAWPRSGRAERQRVLLLAADPELREATASTLAPWQLDVIPGEQPAPGGAMPGAGERAAAAAQQQGARAVVWIARDGTGQALWMFDVASGQAVSRRLASPPPFDAPTAAAAALSIKTMLRHSAVAPTAEKFGAAAAAAAPPRPARLHLDSSGGWRFRAGSRPEPRIGIAALWALPLRLAAGARVQLGPGLAVDARGFAGHFNDTAAALTLRSEQPLARAWHAAGWLDATLHFTEIDGVVLPADRRAGATRVNPAIGAGAAIGARLPLGATVELRGELSYQTRRQRYLVGGEPVLELPSVSTGVGAAVLWPLW